MFGALNLATSDLGETCRSTDISLKYRNFSKFSAPAAQEMCLSTHFSQKFQKVSIFVVFGAEKCVTEQPKLATPSGCWPPPIASLIPALSYGFGEIWLDVSGVRSIAQGLKQSYSDGLVNTKLPGCTENEI